MIVVCWSIPISMCSKPSHFYKDGYCLYISIDSISRHKIGRWIVGFIREPKELIGCSRLIKANHANSSQIQHGHCFPECACAIQSDNQLDQMLEKVSFPKETGALLHVTSHLYSFTSINNALYVVGSWCCRNVVFRSDLHGSDWSKWHWPCWPISNVQISQDLSCPLGFCRLCSEKFPAKMLKLLPITVSIAKEYILLPRAYLHNICFQSIPSKHDKPKF